MIPCLKLTEVLKMEKFHVNEGFKNFLIKVSACGLQNPHLNA